MFNDHDNNINYKPSKFKTTEPSIYDNKNYEKM